jgi:hypothetical protein
MEAKETWLIRQAERLPDEIKQLPQWLRTDSASSVIEKHRAEHIDSERRVEPAPTSNRNVST